MTSQDPTPQANLPAYSVSEISQALKRTVEDRFSFVRVRGEVSRPSRPRSGHVYFTLKDENACLDAVCWRGQVGRLSIQPEEGMEVIATGRLTTYAGQSKYQIVVERLELAGEGALLKLLEERRRRLAAEGLFAGERKRALPYLPDVIGVVTSPTGAVIRDILHRLADRFPRRVLLWPVRVQGEGAAEEVAAAIRGFNAISPDDAAPRPDLLIVARGGGSLEDLMAFNEESVVRAAAESAIPLISAVGHETDTTLIDFAADRRAPTPSAAAEMAVPVRAELLTTLTRDERRIMAAMARIMSSHRLRLDGLSRGLGDPRRLLESAFQSLDDRGSRLDQAALSRLRHASAQLAEVAARLPHPRARLAESARRLHEISARLDRAPEGVLARARMRHESLTPRLGATALRRRVAEARRALDGLDERLTLSGARLVPKAASRLEGCGKLLESYSYRRVLDRGFAVIRDSNGRPVTRAGALKGGQAITMEYADGQRQATVDGGRPVQGRLF